MRQLQEVNVFDFADIEQRPSLAAFARRTPAKVFLLSEWAFTLTEQRWNAHSKILLFVSEKQTYTVISTAAHGKIKERFMGWGADRMSEDVQAVLGGVDGQDGEHEDEATEASGDFVTIRVPREKLGRPRRELTEEEMRKIDKWREGGRGTALSVNEIARRLGVRNRAVMAYLHSLSK